MLIYGVEIEEGHVVRTGSEVHVAAAALEGTFKVASIHLYPANNANGLECRVELEVPLEGEHCTYPEVNIEEVEWA